MHFDQAPPSIGDFEPYLVVCKHLLIPYIVGGGLQDARLPKGWGLCRVLVV